MLTDFSTEYSHRSDDELLHLATQRRSLTTEAAAALDVELRQRNLTESDRVEHQKLVRRQERREARTHRRWKIPGFKYQMGWRDIWGAFASMALIAVAYLALPSRFHLKPDWEEPAVIVMITAVIIVFAADSARKITFWMSLVISSSIQLVGLHALTQRIPNLSHGAFRGVAVLSFLLFLVVCAALRFLQRMLFGKEAAERA